MIHNFQISRPAVLLLTALLTLEGCVWGSVQYDPTLTKQVIKNIEPGKTTRKDILEWLGPPVVLAKKDGMVQLPSLDTNPEETQKIDSRMFFKYFLEEHSLSEHHAVYYYWNEAEDINGFSLPIPIGALFVSVPVTSGNLQLSELWVLVNRETGQVDDYVYLESKEK